ncbi:MAG: translation initiation factor Sui1 [Pontibacterium sp.]
MSSLRNQLQGLVYSTEHGAMCPGCNKAQDACICDELADQERINRLDGVVRIRRETSGRKGKGVTTVAGLPLAAAELKTLSKKLKKLCGTGGSIKDGIIEIQGDHRDVLKAQLEKEGFKVKSAGG